MHAYRARFAALLAASALVAALTAPFAVAADSCDDVSAAATTSNALLRNDVAHFGRTSGAPAPTPAPAAPVVVRVEGGFDWISAGVGAAGGLAAVLAVGVAAAALGVRAHGNEARA